MRRIHLFEIEDQSWLPEVIRQGMTDYLRFVLGRSRFYDPIVPVLRESLEKSGENRLLDLCSGGGGAIVEVWKALNKAGAEKISITLSDKFPNLAAFRYIKEETGGAISYIEEPVDATRVPSSIPGLRTSFSSFHHFQPEVAKKILEDAAAGNRAIAIFDGWGNRLILIIGIIFVHPLLFFFATPFIRPFKISRLVFTYLLPLIPLFTIWDGIISMLRLYNENELEELTKNAGENGYTWKQGVARMNGFAGISYLVGLPGKQKYSERAIAGMD
jgi:hypothetical protein